MLWFFIIVLLVLAVVYLLMPLFRTPDDIVDDRKQQNIRIIQEQMAELESSFERAEVDSEQYSARRNELEQALLLDVGTDVLEEGSVASAQTKKSVTSTTSWLSAGLLAFTIPASAIALYFYLGTPNAIEMAKVPPKPEVPMTADGKPDVEKLVANLHAKMKLNPENAQGWYMLGRSYMLMQRYDGAIEAYENLFRLQPEEADVMVMLADALSMKQQGKMTGRPEALINKALEKVPNNTTALWLSGMALEQKGSLQEALVRWQVLRPLLNGSEAEQAQLDVLIARVEKKIETANSVGGNAEAKVVAKVESTDTLANESTENKDTSATDIVSTSSASKPLVGEKDLAQVSVTITLDEKFAGEVSPEDSVFVYAKAQSGPPLAAKRLQVKDLPITIVLDDDMAMMPQMKLSMFPVVIVGARVSKSGNAISQDGDLYAEQGQVTHGDSVELTINAILKK
jgi:cytochrome c-type biogenesis protein CcmH